MSLFPCLALGCGWHCSAWELCVCQLMPRVNPCPGFTAALEGPLPSFCLCFLLECFSRKARILSPVREGKMVSSWALTGLKDGLGQQQDFWKPLQAASPDTDSLLLPLVLLGCSAGGSQRCPVVVLTLCYLKFRQFQSNTAVNKPLASLYSHISHVAPATNVSNVVHNFPSTDRELGSECLRLDDTH